MSTGPVSIIVVTNKATYLMCPRTQVPAESVWPDRSGHCAAVRRQVVTGFAGDRVGDGAHDVAAGTGRPGTALIVGTVTEGTHGKIADVSMLVGRIIIPERRIRAAIRWMGGECVMATFTAGTARCRDADVEARVAAWATIGRLGVARLTIEQTVGEGRCQSFGGRAMVGRIEEAAIQRVGNRASGPEILKVYRHAGITELVGRVVAMAPCSIAAKIGGVVLGRRVHLDSAVPMIAIGLRGCVVQCVIRGCREVATAGSFLHAMAGYADIMQADIGHIAMDDRHGHIEVSRTIRRNAVAVSAVEGEIGHFSVAAKTADADTTNAIQV